MSAKADRSDWRLPCIRRVACLAWGAVARLLAPSAWGRGSGPLGPGPRWAVGRPLGPFLAMAASGDGFGHLARTEQQEDVLRYAAIALATPVPSLAGWAVAVLALVLAWLGKCRRRPRCTS